MCRQKQCGANSIFSKYGHLSFFADAKVAGEKIFLKIACHQYQMDLPHSTIHHSLMML
jgi:hypothetical protein